MRTSKGYLFRVATAEEPAPALHLGRNSKAGRRVEKLRNGKKEGLQHALAVSCWHEKAVDGPTKRGTSYKIG